MTHGRRHSSLRGFTLIEILVVMTLLALIMVALGSSQRTVAQVENRVDARLGRADESRTAFAFIRSTLGRVSLRKVDPIPESGSPFFFGGAPDAVSWVGVMPARYGTGGRYFFRLAAERAGSTTNLVLRFLPWVDSRSFPDWATAEPRVLMTRITGFSLQYLDGRAEQEIWAPDWSSADGLPDRVRLQVADQAGPWPEIVVPLRGLPGSGTNSDGVTFGGGGGDS